MDQRLLYIGLALLIVLVLVGIYCFLRFGHIERKPIAKSGLDLEKVVAGLGGQENILTLEAEGSKVIFHLQEARAVQADALKALGASGIVSSKDKVTVIFGKVSQPLALELKNYLKKE